MLGLKTFETTNDKRMSSYHLPVSSYSCFAILNSNKTKSSLKRKKINVLTFPDGLALLSVGMLEVLLLF